MKRIRSMVVSGTMAFVSVLTASWAAAAQADIMVGPALFARYPNYTPPAWADPDQAAFGPTCNNDPTQMPAGRQSDCSTGAHERLSAGVYRIKVANGAPLPSSSNDVGWTLFLSPVGSNARCAETATTWSNNELSSTFKCVTPAGNPVDTQFSWIYRNDSFSYMQFNSYASDFGYARVNRGAGNQVVASQTYNAFGNGGVTSQKLATGRFRVTFQDMNLQQSFGFVDATAGMNNVVAQRTCMNDTSADCLRAVCVPTTWSFGSQGGSSTTVDVQCHLGTTPIDVDFRVFIGGQSLTSQYMGNSWSGAHYAWAKSPGFGANVGCKQSTEFTHRGQHEDVYPSFGTLEARACRDGTGRYSVDFTNQSFYSRNRATPLTTSRSVGAYCNVDFVLCGGAGCSLPPNSEVGIRCYDNTTGAAKDALWNVSLTY